MSMETQQRIALLGLSHVEFLRPREKLTLIEMLGSPERLFELTRSDISSLVGRRLATREWKPAEILARAERTEKLLTGGPLGCIFYWDSTYPPQLREIYDPPVTLFHRGTLPENGHSLAGIVGTRFPTGGARKAAFRLGFDLALQGVGVVSGLARGIDREAHEGCVAAGGYSIAVLGSGIDHIYPDSSRAAGHRPALCGWRDAQRVPAGDAAPAVPLSRAQQDHQRPVPLGGRGAGSRAFGSAHHGGVRAGAGAGPVRPRRRAGGDGGSRYAPPAESGALAVHGAREIMSDWGREYRETHGQDAPRDETTGERLARELEGEMEGACAMKGGEAYWRI